MNLPDQKRPLSVFQALVLDQLITTPFRAETGMPRQLIPIYSTMSPPIPPFLPYRKVSYSPSFPSYQQMQQIISPQYLVWQKE